MFAVALTISSHSLRKNMNSKLEIKNGNKIWINVDGEIHREDGPAVEFANGSKFWFLNGVNYSMNEWSFYVN